MKNNDVIKLLRKSLGKSYTLSRIYHERRLSAESKKPGEPIIVFQMGKVGSTSIVDGLHERIPDSPVFHVHFLTDAGISDAKRRLRILVKRFNANAWCLYESDYVRRYLRKYGGGKKIKIVTLFREPIARNISSFFYNVNKYAPDFRSYSRDDELFVDALKHRYLNVFPEHEFPLQWFDKELFTMFGVDVYQQEFDKDKGYSIIRTESTEVLVLKLECLKKCVRPAFREFLGIDDFELAESNRSDDQPYNEFYKDFLENVCLPQEYLDRTYNSKYMTKFYTGEEIAQYRMRWQCCE